MADKKDSELTIVTSAIGADGLAITIGLATTPHTRLITIDNFFKNRTLVAPVLGVATGTSFNGLTITTTTGTLTITNGKTLSVSNTLTFTGTDSSSVAFGGGGTVVYTSNKLSVHAATTSAELASVISDETGSGALVFANTPTLVTPVLGVATATSINGLTITTSTGTLTITNGKTVSVSNTLTFTGTDSSSVAFGGGGTVVYTSNKLSVHAATTSAELASVISDETGTGALVFANTPTLVTPVLGAATATTINGAALDNNAWSSYSPTVASTGGTITTLGTVTGRYKQIGKTVFVEAMITITTNGTGSGAVSVSLPFTASGFGFVLIGRGTASSGKMLQGQISPNGTTATVVNYDNTYPGASGETIYITGVFESA